MPSNQHIRAFTVAALVGALVLGACGSSGETTRGQAGSGSGMNGATPASGAATAPAQPFSPVVAMAEPLVGKNRFALGILDGRTNAPLPDATVKFRFFELHGNQGTLRFEADAVFRAPARDAGLATAVQHRHADGSLHIHSNAEADVGVYTANVTFDKAGQWGVQALIQTKDGRQGAVQTAFEVAAQAKTPVPGEQAPRSRQLIARDVKHLSEIDTSAEPVAALHDITIADAIASGKPSVVLFATPGFCSSRICGPSYEILKKLMEQHQGKAHFIHIEVWQDFDKKVTTPTFQEWRLTSEPWFYIIDGKGVIHTRFDGPTTFAELDAALRELVQ
jgi:hypothetical protein